MGNFDEAIKTHYRILECLRTEWGYTEDDKIYIEELREINSK